MGARFAGRRGPCGSTPTGAADGMWELRFSVGTALTWNRTCRAPWTMHIRRPRKMKKGTTSSRKWLLRVSKRWNHHGERCRK